MNWELIEIRASDIIVRPGNPKIRNEVGFNRLKKSLDKFGRIYDGIINYDNSLIDGHSRLETVENEDEILRVFKPSQLLSDKDFLELRAIFDISRAGDPDFEIITNIFDDVQLDEWEINFHETILNNNIKSDENDGGENQKIVLEYTNEEYWIVKKKLSEIAATPEQAVYILLESYADND